MLVINDLPEIKLTLFKCLNFSKGRKMKEIIGILKLYDGIQDYFEVKFDKNTGVVNLYPIDYKTELRVISNPIELTGVLKKTIFKNC